MFILNFLQGFPHWLIILIISAIPVIELRGAIPLALTVWGMPVIPVLILGIIGSVLPVFPILWFLDFATKIAHRFPRLGGFLDWLFTRTRAKSKQIERYEFWGLVIFIGIPLPGTGVWTGTVAAYLLGLSPWKTFWAGFLGTAIAGLIMTAGILGLKALF